MNILDFENEFETFITFEGDNEQDINDLTIRREQYDKNGAAIIIAEHFSMDKEALEEVMLGLQEMANKIRDYLSEYEQ